MAHPWRRLVLLRPARHPAHQHEDAFITALLGSLGSFPPYFLRLAETNRHGVLLDTDPGLPALDVAAVRSLLAGGALMVDVRPVPEFAAGRVPGALSIPLRPVVILRGPDQDGAEVAWQAAKIGYTNLTGGMDAWAAAGHPTSSTRLVRSDQIGSERVLDIRQTPEFTAGHLPGASHAELGALAERVGEVPLEPLVVMCGHGERAMGAASLLEQAGHRDLAVLDGGPDDWTHATGRALETGA